MGGFYVARLAILYNNTTHKEEGRGGRNVCEKRRDQETQALGAVTRCVIV